jgi:hypothetical protein
MNTRAFPKTPSTSSRYPRRGVLLLIVLSMLTLFLMLGTAYLVVSSRSRQTARAFAKLAMHSDTFRIPSAQLVDAAFLRVVRGGTTFGLSSAPPNGITMPTKFESLLEDKYGSSTTGTATSVIKVANAPLLLISGINIDGYPNNAPAGLYAVTDFPGRVITLLGAGREPTSHRIIRSSTDAGQLTLCVDIQSDTRPFRAPPGKQPAWPFVINGPEFQIHEFGKKQGPSGPWVSGTSTNEPWDAFDDSNQFLTQLAPGSTIASASVKKIGLVDGSISQTLLSSSTGQSPTISRASEGFAYGGDNDGDGQVDGLFFNAGLPTQHMANGDTVNFDVSALIVDLDSRFNVNAHGSLAAYSYTGNSSPHPGWPQGTAQRVTWSATTSSTTTLAVPTFSGLPAGSGYGPPEVSGAWMFPASSYPAAGSKDSASPPTSTYGLLTLSGVAQDSQTGLRANGSRFATTSSTPRVSNLEGRYGDGQFASTSSVNTLDTGSYLLADAAFPLALPGAPRIDDRLSQFTDRGSSTVLGIVNSTRGIPTIWWDGSRSYNWLTSGTVSVSGSTSQITSRAAYNSPPDLHGRMITTTSASAATDVVPRLSYAKPEWGATEAQDDPYEARLDPKAPRSAQYVTSGTVPAADNIFSISELEPVLRPYDRDTLHLPQRLAAILGGVAEEAKLRVTTDSWDTTAITGTAAGNIRDWQRKAAADGVAPLFGNSAVTGLIGGEVARGERFNLNRPFNDEKPAVYSATHPYYVQRQSYFKDLYTLMVAVSGTASRPDLQTRRKYAQWAANVVEFRDADSTMTPFEYDSDPANGWDVDGNVMTTSGESDRAIVWGAERPEAIIAATSAWENSSTGEMFILLHRPWNAVAFSRSGGASQAVPGEPIDVELDVMQGNTGRDLLNLSRKSGNQPFDPNDTDTYPVWRIRLVDEETKATIYVRFDISTSGTTNELTSPSLSKQYSLGANSWQCVMGANTAGMNVLVPNNPTFSGFVPPGTRPQPNNTTSGTATVYLERLTDPRATIDAAVWNGSPNNDDPAGRANVAMYRVVDRATMRIVNREPPAIATPPVNPYSITKRSKTELWRWPAPGSPAEPTPTDAPDVTQVISIDHADFNRSNGGQAMWFPWNNRPFASSAELYLVPGSDPNAAGNGKDTLGLLQQYVPPRSPATLPALSGSFIPTGMFDAVHVPTRFAGIHTTGTTAGVIAALAANAGIYSDTVPVNQLSSFREPARVNLNTVTATDVWNAVVAGPLQTSGSAAPVKTITQADFAATPAKGMHNILTLSGSVALAASGTTPPIQDSHPALSDLQAFNPAHNIYTANRLANTATVRSNVFGVWITVRESVANDPDSIKLHRAFYIIDRSIPVAFEAGKDHNVWNAVLLRRLIP